MDCTNSNLPPGFDPVAAGYDEPSDYEVVAWAMKQYGEALRCALNAVEEEGGEAALALGRIITGESDVDDEDLVVRAATKVANDYPVEFNDAFRGRGR